MAFLRVSSAQLALLALKAIRFISTVRFVTVDEDFFLNCVQQANLQNLKSIGDYRYNTILHNMTPGAFLRRNSTV